MKVRKIFENDNSTNKQRGTNLYYRNPQRRKPKQRTAKVKCISQENFIEKKSSGLILKEKILGKTGSKGQTKTNFIKHNNPMSIQTKRQLIC